MTNILEDIHPEYAELCWNDRHFRKHVLGFHQTVTHDPQRRPILPSIYFAQNAKILEKTPEATMLRLYKEKGDFVQQTANYIVLDETDLSKITDNMQRPADHKNIRELLNTRIKDELPLEFLDDFYSEESYLRMKSRLQLLMFIDTEDFDHKNKLCDKIAEKSAEVNFCYGLN